MTDDTPLPFDLPSVRRKKLTVDFAGGNQSSNGGVLLLREAERKHGVCLRLAEAMPDRRNPDRICHAMFEMVMSRVLAIAGALTALPFHLLVTEPPPLAVPQVKDIAAYRDAAFLVKRQAVSVLPSVASLQALRVFARGGQATKPMVGFGDPVFDPAERAIAVAARARLAKQAAKSRPTATRAYSDFWQGAGADRTQLARGLPSLLDTADELKSVAAKLGAPAGDIHLASDASETTVKRTALVDYRVVYFATHGLVAGDVQGLGEPSLALTLPKEPTQLDDGLLTASEVAQLKLNADWVVLSACNTIAGDKPGAEALSGLARAFFYAGARALLVSHWSVESGAATRLTTSTFDIMKSNPTVGRAEALRRAMLAYMNDKGDPLNAYPAFWGAFSVVGEGGAALGLEPQVKIEPQIKVERPAGVESQARIEPVLDAMVG